MKLKTVIATIIVIAIAIVIISMTYFHLGQEKTVSQLVCYDSSPVYLKIENKTTHQIDIVFYYNVAKMGYLAYDSLKVEPFGRLAVSGDLMEDNVDPKMRCYWSDSALVSFDGKTLIKHYRDSVDRKIKSYNKKSPHSFYSLGSYTGTAYPSGSSGEESVVYAYSFTEDDYLFATK